jgi:AcrR family transcriptional regulator
MTLEPPAGISRRSDAQRNRARILDAARLVFTAPADDPPDSEGAAPEQSMAEVARRAGVGRGTLYRNFPGRRELLEALFRDEVDALVDAAVPSDDNPGDALLGWLHRFAAFEGSKHAIASELLESTDSANPMFGSSRQRVISAGEPLLAAAQLAGHVRRDITLVQALDLVLAVVRLDREPDQIAVILQVALDGLRAGSR